MRGVGNNVDAIRFLQLILPEQGHYIAAIKNAKSKGFKPSTFASTIEDLWSIIEEHDRDGFETYHACASYREPMNDRPGIPAKDKRFGRTKHNIFGAKAFWLDIDVGPGKPYGTIEAAYAALATFCRVLDLPDPIVVESGSGLHVYWPLRHMLDRPAWERYANGLKRLCVKHGLHVDQSRTTDISSVLRTPGRCGPRFGWNLV
jgi:hypothetical protein